MYLVQTVQTSWRPQLPLPKDYPPQSPETQHSTSDAIAANINDISMDKHHSNVTPKHLPHQPHPASHTAPADLPQRKWSLGGLFRRKKKASGDGGEQSDSTSDEAQRAGFKEKTTPSPNRKSKSRARRAGHKLLEAFDHIVVTPLGERHSKQSSSPNVGHPQTAAPPPQRMATPPESIRSGSGSLDRRLRRERIRASRVYSREPGHSSDEAGDAVSHNSLSSMSRFRSDESLANSAGSGSHRRSRSARTERYLKRMSKCEDGVSIDGGRSGSGRWQTQPVQYSHQMQMQQQQQQQQHHNAYDASPYQHSSLRSSASMSHVPTHVPNHWNVVPMRAKYPAPTPAGVGNPPPSGGLSYEAQLHQITRSANQPPPPPPRDPQRRLTTTAAETRPVSYAFDQHPHSGNQPLPYVTRTHESRAPTMTQRMSARCVSDDRLWGTQEPSSSQYMTTFAQPQPQSITPQRRFITRNPEPQPPVPPAHPANAPAAAPYRYVADAAPRSRRPIHLVNHQASGQPESTEQRMLRTSKSGLPASPMKNAADFWKKLDQETSPPATTPPVGKLVLKPRSVSHSRVHAPAGRYHTHENVDHVDGVVTGSLVLKPSRSCIFQPSGQSASSFGRYELSEPPAKGDSLPSHYSAKNEAPVNKYEEHVAKSIAQPAAPFNRGGAAKPFAYITAVDTAPDPPHRKLAPIDLPVLRPTPSKIAAAPNASRKSTNLEDAINELEAIYKSLRLDNDTALLDRAERRDITTPQPFDEAAARYADSASDSDSPPPGEPDIVLDDVVYRNLRRANSIPRTVEAQPMFGIPIGPIPPSPGTDYLHAPTTNTTNATTKTESVRTSRPMFVAQKSPDPVSDDLAVRLLRKDVAMAASRASMAVDAQAVVTPRLALTRNVDAASAAAAAEAAGSTKKNRAVRSMSANIYNLIQRDAAKPSGGCLEDYSRLEKGGAQRGSLNDISDVSDHPTTLFMLQRERKISESEAEAKARAQARAAKASTTESTNKGAVFNLPSTLKSSPVRSPSISRQSPAKAPMPLPRSPSRSPQSQLVDNGSGMNDILNAIAREAQESSAKLSRDLFELRNEIKAQQQHQQKQEESHEPLAQMTEDIDRAAEDVQQCLKVLQHTVPAEKAETSSVPKKKIENEVKMMQDIQTVGDAAKQCERMLVSALQPTAAPAPEEPAVKVVNDEAEEEPTSIAKLLEKLEPESRKIGAIAERCMRQLSQLGEMHVEIYGKQAKPLATTTGDYDNLHPANMYGLSYNSKPSSGSPPEDVPAQTVTVPNTTKPSVQEELDKIMAECAEEAEKLSKPTITIDAFVNEEESESKQQHGEVVDQDDDDDDDDDEDNEEMNIILLPPNALTPTHPYEENTVTCSSTVTFDDSLPVPDVPTTGTSKSSSEDRKSSSATPNRAHSSNLTSSNAQSSSDYAGKSLSGSTSSNYHLAPSTAASDDLKSHSTTSCDHKSTTSSTNNTTSPTTTTTTTTNESSSHVNRSPSPRLALTPSGDERSLYNSSEELAMIFGIRNDVTQSGKTANTTTTTTINPPSPSASTASPIAPQPPQSPPLLPHAPQQHVVAHRASVTSEIRSAFVSLATILEAHEEFHAALDRGTSPLYTSSVSIDMTTAGGVRQSSVSPSSPNSMLMAGEHTSYSSMESIESTPDSGNHSLNDYPLRAPATTPSTTSTYRSEVTINTAQTRDMFTSELSIGHDVGAVSFVKELSHVEEVTIAIVNHSTGHCVDAAVVVCAQPPVVETIASIEERFNDIYDELVEINDEFFRCSTSLSLATIDEDDERDFERLVREECADIQFDDAIDSNQPEPKADADRSPSADHSRAEASSNSICHRFARSQPPSTEVAAAGSVHMLEPNHLLWACTVALANSDLLTLLAIVVAIITILALILF